MQKDTKIALGITLAPLVVSGILVLKGAMTLRRINKQEELEIAAKNYATAEVLKKFLNNEVMKKEDYDAEWQFAYMNYRAHH